VNDELRIGAAAQFVQVHADALAVGVHAEGNDAVEQPEEQVDQRQHQAEQRGDADQLGHELAGLRREDAGGEQSPQAADGVDGDGAGGVVDGDGASSSTSTSSGVMMPATMPTKSDSAGVTRAAQALEATRPASQPLAQRLASGLPKRMRVTAKVAASAPEAESSVLTAVTGSAASGAWSQRGAGEVPGQPADQRQQAAEEDIDGVVAGHGGGEALLGELARRGPAIQTTASALRPPRTWTVAAPPGSRKPAPRRS
jgi:hypothetical protein